MIRITITDWPIKATDHINYDDRWTQRITKGVLLPASDYEYAAVAIKERDELEKELECWMEKVSNLIGVKLNLENLCNEIIRVLDVSQEKWKSDNFRAHLKSILGSEQESLGQV